MSTQAYLVSMKKKEVLNLGKILRDEDNTFTAFTCGGLDDEKCKNAIYNFLLDHAKDDTRLMTSAEYDLLDLTGFIRVTEDYGIPFRGPRKIHLEE